MIAINDVRKKKHFVMFLNYTNNEGSGYLENGQDESHNENDKNDDSNYDKLLLLRHG